MEAMSKGKEKRELEQESSERQQEEIRGICWQDKKHKTKKHHSGNKKLKICVK